MSKSVLKGFVMNKVLVMMFCVSSCGVMLHAAEKKPLIGEKDDIVVFLCECMPEVQALFDNFTYTKEEIEEMECFLGKLMTKVEMLRNMLDPICEQDHALVQQREILQDLVSQYTYRYHGFTVGEVSRILVRFIQVLENINPGLKQVFEPLPGAHNPREWTWRDDLKWVKMLLFAGH